MIFFRVETIIGQSLSCILKLSLILLKTDIAETYTKPDGNVEMKQAQI